MSDEDFIFIKLAFLYFVVIWMLYSVFWHNAAEEMWQFSKRWPEWMQWKWAMERRRAILLIKVMTSILCIGAVLFSISMIIEYLN